MNPLDVDPSRFVVAEEDGERVGFAQIKPLGADCFELASVYVEEAYRRRGVGKRLVSAALDGFLARGHRLTDLYCLTLAKTTPFYTDLGFHTVVDNTPPDLAFELAAGKLVTKLIGEDLVVMRAAHDEKRTTGEHGTEHGTTREHK